MRDGSGRSSVNPQRFDHSRCQRYPGALVANCSIKVTSAYVRALHVDVPTHYEAMVPGSDVREVVALHTVVAYLRSLCMVDVDRSGLLVLWAMIAL